MLPFNLIQMELVVVLMLRILGFFATAPFFSGKYFNMYIKAALALTIGMTVAYTFPNLNLEYSVFESPFGYALICVIEALIGAIIGFSATIVFNVIIFAGSLIDSQTGLTMASVYDPTSSNQIAITANLYYYALLAVFLSTNMHHNFIKAIFFSYQVVPIGVFNVSRFSLIYLFDVIQDFFILSLKFASPIIASMLILDVGLGILVRAVPQMNVFVVGFPLKLAIFMLIMIVSTKLFIDNYAVIFEMTIDVMSNFIKLFAVPYSQ